MSDTRTLTGHAADTADRQTQIGLITLTMGVPSLVIGSYTHTIWIIVLGTVATIGGLALTRTGLRTYHGVPATATVLPTGDQLLSSPVWTAFVTGIIGTGIAVWSQISWLGQIAFPIAALAFLTGVAGVLTLPTTTDSAKSITEPAPAELPTA